MKITIVNNVYFPEAVGGAEISTQLLAESLVAAGLNVQVVSLGANNEMFLHNGVLVNKVARRQEKGGRFSNQVKTLQDVHDPWMGKTVATLISLHESDLVHTNNLPGFSWAIWDAVSSGGIPVVHTLRDFSVICRGAMFSGGHACPARCPSCRILSYRRKLSSSKVAAVIGNSTDTLCRHLDEGFFPMARVQKAIHTIGPDGGTARLRPQREQGRWRFGFLGRPTPEKGLELLCEAMSSAPTTWELHIGARLNSSEEKALRNAAGDARVVFHGYVRATEFLEQVDVVVVPSLWYEPLPRAAIEAQSHGVPVVASRIGGIPEVVADKVNGVLFDPSRGASELRRAMEILTDPEVHAKMVAASFRDRSRFSVERCRDAYLAVYREILK